MVGSARGSYPIIRKKGDFPVTECRQWLWVNSVWVIELAHVVG